MHLHTLVALIKTVVTPTTKPARTTAIENNTVKKITLIFLLLSAGIATAQTHVRPYIRDDGTFVEGHVRSAPNGTSSDNYSTRGNVNPYTGQAGTVHNPNPWR